jgi:hypothetical protein
MSLQMSSSDVTFLPPNNQIRSVVSDDPNKYKIFELYVNELLFPNTTDDGIDLFITLTPCSGLLKFYISDDYNKLFTERSEVSRNNKFSSIAVTVENMPDSASFTDAIRVIHKTSKVSTGL